MASPAHKRNAHQPERRCVVTGESYPTEQLLRFVLSPENVVVPDIKGVLPGRGVWTLCRKDVVHTACSKGSFARGFKQKVDVPDGLAEQAEQLLAQQALSLLGMARKSGNLVLGLDPLKEALVKQSIALICMAKDAGKDGRERMLNDKVSPPLVTYFVREQLQAALGRNNVVYIGIKSVIVCATLCRALERLVSYAGGNAAQQAVDGSQSEAEL